MHNRVHRFSPAAQQAVALMDGTHSVAAIWDALGRLGEERPTQDELIHLLAQLDGAELLATERRPDFGELADRAAGKRSGSLAPAGEPALYPAAADRSRPFPVRDAGLRAATLLASGCCCGSPRSAGRRCRPRSTGAR